MATKITKVPNVAVSNLGAPTMGSDNHVMTATWKVPAKMTKAKSKSRATNLIVAWAVNASDGALKLTNKYGTNVTSVDINLDSFKIGNTTYNRASFYPTNKDRKLNSVSITVTGWNKKCKGDKTGKAVTTTQNFNPPLPPTVDGITFNTENGILSTTVHAAESSPYRERYDTKYRVIVRGRDGVVRTTSDSASTSGEFNLTYDASDYMNLDPDGDEYIQMTVEAYSRGYAGDSNDGKPTTATYYLSYPAKATITGVDISDSSGKLTVGVNTNKSTTHPVDKVTLEYMANTTFENASDITGSWTDAEIEDNANCTALAMPVENLVPDRGRYTWIRVKTIHAHEGVLVKYSDYKRLEKLETPPAEAAEDSITILDAHSGEGGQSAVVLLGWNRSGTDDSTGTELTWSDEEDTWKSTKEPETHEFTWSDGQITHGGQTYHDSAEITIKGLSEGNKYFVRARRYYEGETTSYGRYSNTATVLTSEKPAGVVARCNKYIADGQPLQVYWTFSGNGIQTEWQIVQSNGTVIESGKGSLGTARISAERLKSLAVNNSLTFTVQVSTGSGFVSSEEKAVTILEKPTLSINSPATMTAQPYSFTASSNKACDLTVIVTAHGSTGQFPQGVLNQPAGDTIYSDVVSPTWTNGSATVTLPVCDGFWDLGSYELSVVAEDRDTKLRSSEATADFKVAWANKAVDPDDFITLTPIDEIDEDGDHILAVQIDLTPPTGSRASDVYDIYRMDGGQPCLIGRGFPLTYTGVDEFAPFGDNEELSYRVAIRTVDGDTEFADIEYELPSKSLRLDWQGGSLELPYGNSIGDTYKKDVEFRQHMDGSVDGYWNRNIEHGGSYNSSIIKLIQPEEVNMARALARYAGAVFVRTPNGSAFPADVQVTDLSVKNKAVTAIAIDATEVGLTEEFMLPNPYEAE